MNTTKKNKLYAPFAFSVAAMSGFLFTVSCTGMGKHAMMGSDDNNNQSCNKGESNSQAERAVDITRSVNNSAQHGPTNDEKKQVTSDQVREKGSQFHQAIIDNNENIFNEILNADESIINYVANVCFDENENKFYLDTNDQPNTKRYAPLTMAIIYSRLDFVKKMLASEKTKFYHKEADLQPVHHAASKEDGQALDMLLSDKRCLTDDFINATDIHGHTPTQAAVLRCKTDNFKNLLKHEYNNLNFTDKDKNNPSLLLHLVVDAAIAYQNNPNKIKKLQAITTEILDNPKIDLNQKNAKGRTALWRVAAQPPGKLDEKITRDISMHKRVNPNASAKPGASDDMATVYKVAHMQCNEVVKKCLDERAKTEHVNRRLSYRYALWRSYNKWFRGYKSN